MPVIETTPDLVRDTYERVQRNLEIVRRRLGRPLSYAEKILLGHLDKPADQELVPGRHRTDGLAPVHLLGT